MSYNPKSKKTKYICWCFLVVVITHSGKNCETSISHMWAASSLQDPEDRTHNVNEWLTVCACSYLCTEEESFTLAVGSWGRGRWERRLWYCCSQTHTPSAVCDSPGTNSQSHRLWFAARRISHLSVLSRLLHVRKKQDVCWQRTTKFKVALMRFVHLHSTAFIVESIHSDLARKSP